MGNGDLTTLKQKRSAKVNATLPFGYNFPVWARGLLQNSEMQLHKAVSAGLQAFQNLRPLLTLSKER